MITPDEIKGWTDAEVSVGAQILNEESSRRATLSHASRRVAEVNAEYLLAVGRESGEPWVDPEGTEAAYPKGWHVTRSDKRWESTVNGNRSEPGTNDDWRDVTDIPDAGDEMEPQVWEPPSGNGFGLGSTVTHKSKTWTSDVDNNVWEPGGDYGWTEKAGA